MMDAHGCNRWIEVDNCNDVGSVIMVMVLMQITTMKIL